MNSLETFFTSLTNEGAQKVAREPRAVGLALAAPGRPRAKVYCRRKVIGYYFYAGRYLDAIHEVLDPTKKTIVHIPNVNARESLGDKIREAD